ncbi:MAG: hypothetical protein CMH54_11600 [Myxococcales bacterium]|nr:hypothetical protein [Myxococcales bacterium]
MRFTCVKCNTRYRINPQHLQGGTSVRIRCRNCGAVLRVRAPGADPSESPTSDLGTTADADPITSTQPTSPPPEAGSSLAPTDWHRVVDGQSDGPHSLEKMVELAKGGGLLKTTLIWEPNWAEWKPAGHVALFKNAIDEGLQAALSESPTRSTDTPSAVTEEELSDEEPVEEVPVEEEPVEEVPVEEEPAEEEPAEEEPAEEEPVEEAPVEEEPVEEEPVEEEPVEEEPAEEEPAEGPDLNVLEGGRDDDQDDEDDDEGQEYDTFEQAFFSDEVAAEHQTLSQAEIESLEEVARSLEEEEKERRTREKTEAEGISLKGIKYDKSELSVSGPDPSARESRMLRKQFGVMKEMDKENNRRKIYFIAGAVIVGVVGTLFIIDLMKPTTNDGRTRRSASAYNSANQKTLDIVETTPDLTEQVEIESTQASAKKTKRTTKRRKNRGGTPIELTGEAVVVAPKKTKLEKKIAERDKLHGLSAKEYERLLADPDAKRGERRIKLQGTDNLGVKERPITPSEFQERLRTWRKSIWSCTSNEQMTVTIVVNISGGVEKVDVEFPVPDPAGSACVRNILLRKRFHLLPARQTVSARITRPL